jgi:hypothetical protein
MSSVSASIAISNKIRSGSKITAGISSSLPSSLRDSSISMCHDKISSIGGVLMNSSEIGIREGHSDHHHQSSRDAQIAINSSTPSEGHDRRIALGISSKMDLENVDGKIDHGSVSTGSDSSSSGLGLGGGRGGYGIGIGIVNHNGVVVMDHEHDFSIISNHGSRLRKHAFNPDDPDLPPHLSEYFEQNVIAILNRCDPQRGRKCYSCGYDNTEKFQQEQQGTNIDDTFYYGFRNSVGYEDETYNWNGTSYSNNPGRNNSYGSDYSHHNQTSPHQQDLNSWNYNNYNTGYFGGGQSAGGYFPQNQSGVLSGSGNNDMDVGNRRRFNSDGAHSDSDAGNAMDDDEVFTFDVSWMLDYFDISYSRMAGELSY